MMKMNYFEMSIVVLVIVILTTIIRFIVKNKKLKWIIGIIGYAIGFAIFLYWNIDYKSNYVDTFIYPTSSTKVIKLDYNDLPTEEETRIAIGEIYARYGEVFIGDNEDLNTYFQQYYWYNEAVEEAAGDYFGYYDLNYIEQYNVWLLEGLYDGIQDPSVYPGAELPEIYVISE